MSIGDGDLISVRGPSLTVIERHVQDGDPRWAKVTHWVKYKETVAITARIASAVRSLWECGKNRRLGGGDLTRLWFFDREEWDRIQDFRCTVEVAILLALFPVEIDGLTCAEGSVPGIEMTLK